VAAGAQQGKQAYGRHPAGDVPRRGLFEVVHGLTFADSRSGCPVVRTIRERHLTLQLSGFIDSPVRHGSPQ